jgi:Phage terminase, small subunit
VGNKIFDEYDQKVQAVRDRLSLKRKANALQRSMLDSLKARGLTEQIYSDMVGDYLELWWTRAELEEDIQERGVTVMDEKRGLPVENCSVSARVRVSAQMAKIYKALGCQELAVKNQAPEDEDDAL